MKASERTGARLAAIPGAVEARTWREIRFGLCRARPTPRKRLPRGLRFRGQGSAIPRGAHGPGGQGRALPNRFRGIQPTRNPHRRVLRTKARGPIDRRRVPEETEELLEMLMGLMRLTVVAVAVLAIG